MSKRMTYRYYAKLLTEKRIELDEIPNKYKDDVLNYIENGDNINKFNDNPTVFDQHEELLPAENLDEITALIRMKSDQRDIHTILNDDVFNVNNIDQARRNISSDLLKWLKNMPLYFETSTFIFVHAGLNPWIRNWKETDEHYMTWDIQDSHRSIPNINKFCVIGHHHASKVRANGIAEGCGDYNINDATYSLNWEPDDNRGRSYRIKSYGNTDENRPYINGNKIAIDGMTNLTGKVNVLVIEDYPLEDPNPTQEPNKPQGPDLSSTDIKVNYPNFGEVTYATTGPTGFTYHINVDEPMFYENITTTTWRG